MSTTDKEQVTPTVEAKLSSDEVKALREKKDQLSTSIRQTVLDPKAKLPEEGSAQQLRSEHVQLTEQAETAKQQAERLTEAKLQVEPLVQECQGLEKELATARESLNEFYQPLGVAAFAGQLAGQIKDVSALADRLVVHEKVTQLQQEREALTPSADAKMLEKTKAKAQQLAAAGKIKIEQTKIGKLDKQIGQQLLGEQQEETVRCDETSAILDQISERRAEISEKEGKVAESTASFASSRDEVTKKLALSPFETVAELDIQIKENNTLTASAQKQLALLERELPDRLVADEELRSSDSELGQQVQELAEIQSQLKTAGPSLAGLGQLATKIKDAWSGLSTRGKAITVGVIALIAVSATMMTESGESTGEAGVSLVNSIGMRFVPISAGTFTMGEGLRQARSIQLDTLNSELTRAEIDMLKKRLNKNAHKVTLTQAFHLGQYEVTQEQYEKVMGKNPSMFKGKQNPVEMVSWNDAVEFCRKLSELPEEKSAGIVYRLPTDAEWEYACRAGTTTKYSFGDSESELSDYAWYDENSGKTPHPVGGKKPNGWGLYDMHGNVIEWCQDWYEEDYASGSVTDPTGAAKGSDRVFRGGSWVNSSDYHQSAMHEGAMPGLQFYTLGFRVLRSSVK